MNGFLDWLHLPFGNRGVARHQQADADFRSLESAIQMYRLNAGVLPPTDAGLEALVVRPATLPDNGRWVQIMTKVPSDPWGNPYRYVAGAGYPDGFGFYSVGPDGISATIGNDRDDLNSWTPDERQAPADAADWVPLILFLAVLSVISAFGAGIRCGRRKPLAAT